MKRLTLAACAALLWSVVAAAAVIRVPSDHPTIQGAIDASSNGDTILVAPGLYTGTGNTNLLFGGKAITLSSTHGSNETTIDGEGINRALLFTQGETLQTRVNGFTIQNCDASSDILVPHGGAMQCIESSPSIFACVFRTNSAPVGSGGAAYIEDSNPVFKDVLFEENTSYYIGGAIFSENGMPKLFDVTCIRNKSLSSGGGAMYFRGADSSPQLSNCSFQENHADSWGGAICIGGGDTLLLQECMFLNNSAGERGGAIMALNYSDSFVENCFFGGNLVSEGRADFEGGGAIYINDGTFQISNSEFSGNSSNSAAGAVLIQSPSAIATFSNCLIHNNDANRFSGAIYCMTGEIIVNNSVIVNNSTETPGDAGIYCEEMSRSTITSSIVFANGDQELHEPSRLSTSIFDVAYCIVRYGWPGIGNLASNPQFLRPSLGDFRLAPFSPAIDAGDPTMEDGKRSPGLEGIRADMGAYGGPGNTGWEFEEELIQNAELPFTNNAAPVITREYFYYPAPDEYQVRFQLHQYDWTTGDPPADATGGRPTLAVYHGTVTHAGWLGGYGTSVIVQHFPGITSQYSNLRDIASEIYVGKEVQKGEFLATIQTGGLDFSVRRNGDSIPIDGISDHFYLEASQFGEEYPSIYASRHVMPDLGELAHTGPASIHFPFQEAKNADKQWTWTTYGGHCGAGQDTMACMDFNWGSGDDELTNSIQVLAPATCIVDEVGYVPGPNNFGHFCWLDLGNDYWYFLAHFDEISVNEEDMLQQGTVLGLVGKSGGPWGLCVNPNCEDCEPGTCWNNSHIHAELWHGGRRGDPGAERIKHDGVSGYVGLPPFRQKIHSWNELWDR